AAPSKAPRSLPPVNAPARSTNGGASRPLPEAARLNSEEGLPVPEAVGAPVAMAEDAVSGRIVTPDESSDTLKIVSELSTNAVDLVSRGWAGNYRTTAIAIDGRRGDLWVVGADASTGQSESALH